MKRYVKRKEFLNGEFIPTYYSWKSLDTQKKIVSRLENITRPKNNNEDGRLV